VLCLRSSTSLCLYHLLFDLLNLYLLKDFIVAYFFREKNGKIYFKKETISNRNGGESESERSNMNRSASSSSRSGSCKNSNAPEGFEGNHEHHQ